MDYFVVFLWGIALGANSIRWIDQWRSKRSGTGKVEWTPPYPSPPFKDRPKGD